MIETLHTVIIMSLELTPNEIAWLQEPIHPERPTQMEVYPSEVYQSPKLLGMDYNRKCVEGYAFYTPTHWYPILFIKVKLVDGEIVPEKDANNGMYTYVICMANPYKWRVAFGAFHDIANVDGVNFWFKQKPVDELLPVLHFMDVGDHARVIRDDDE